MDQRTEPLSRVPCTPGSFEVEASFHRRLIPVGGRSVDLAEVCFEAFLNILHVRYPGFLIIASEIEQDGVVFLKWFEVGVENVVQFCQEREYVGGPG